MAILLNALCLPTILHRGISIRGDYPDLFLATSRYESLRGVFRIGLR